MKIWTSYLEDEANAWSWKHWATKPNDGMQYLRQMKVSLLPYLSARPFIHV